MTVARRTPTYFGRPAGSAVRGVPLPDWYVEKARRMPAVALATRDAVAEERVAPLAAAVQRIWRRQADELDPALYASFVRDGVPAALADRYLMTTVGTLIDDVATTWDRAQVAAAVALGVPTPDGPNGAWQRQRVAEIARPMADTTYRGMRDAADILRQAKVDPVEGGRLLKSMVGLTAPDAAAAARRYVEAAGRIGTREALQAAALDARQLLNARADAIAQTEVTAAAKAGGSGDVPVTSHAHANGYAVKAYLAGGTMTADGKGQLRIDVHDPSGAVVASATSTKAYDVWSAREAAVQVSHHALRVEAEASAAKPAPAKPAAAPPAVTKPAAAAPKSGGGAHDDPVRPTQLVRSVTEKGNEWVPASRKGFYTEVDHDVVPPGTTWATMWDQKRRVDLHVATAPKGWELRDDGAWHKGGDATQRAAVDPGGRHFNNVSAGGDGLPHVSGPVRRITNEAGKAQAQRAAEIKDVRERRRQANVADVARLRGDFEKSDAHAAWARSLTPEERQAIGTYAYLEYGSMNAHLRGGGSLSRGGRLLPNVDRAIGRARVPFDVTTYRGSRADGLIDPEKFDRNPAAFIGKTFTDKGFGSTSLNRQTGESSARRDEDTHKPGVLYEIRVPKGARGAFIDLKRDGILESAGDENELLLHRGTKYRVVSGGDREENGALHVVVEVVP